MRLAAVLQIFGGGPGSGCEGPNCGRPSGGATPHVNEHATNTIAQEQEKWPSTEYMRLRLTGGHSLPTLFRNGGNTVWHWSPDEKTLHIEEISPYANFYGFQKKEVYDVPRENIEEWVPASGQSQEHTPWRVMQQDRSIHATRVQLRKFRKRN